MSYLITSDKLKLGVIIGSSIILAEVIRRYFKQKQEKIPTSWTKVGEVTDLICFPIKSGGWIRLNEFDCDFIGVGKGKMRDRTFMIVNEDNGVFVTGRKYPKLIHIMPTFEDDDTMRLSAPGKSSIQVNFNELLDSELEIAECWDEKVEVHDAGDEVAKWISQFILNKDKGLRLVFFPSKIPTRDVRQKNKVFKTAIPSDTGALHDATGYNLINEASIEDLNSKLDTKVSPLWFRPNIVIKGPKAFEEDSWKFVKIGNSTIFKNVKPCTRCIFTTINPETGEKSANEEPLKTLKTYRKQPLCGDSPVMGIHLGIREFGNGMKVGDSVYIGY